MGELEGHDPSRMRISDDDRHKVAEVLREAAGEGRIDLDELDERLEATWAAKTYGDLVPITADLPVVAPQSSSAVRRTGPTMVPGRDSEVVLALMGGVDRGGDWVVPRHLSALALMGGINLDLRGARFSGREIVMTVNAIMGGADIVVGPDVDVKMEGIGIMGGFAGPSGRVPFEPGPGTVTLRVRGLALMGGVNVHRRPPSSEDPRLTGRPPHGQLH
jgi:hypothetical protein